MRPENKIKFEHWPKIVKSNSIITQLTNKMLKLLAEKFSYELYFQIISHFQRQFH